MNNICLWWGQERDGTVVNISGISGTVAHILLVIDILLGIPEKVVCCCEMQIIC